MAPRSPALYVRSAVASMPAVEQQISTCLRALPSNAILSVIAYIDNGVSGLARRGGEAFQALMADATEGRFDLLIVRDLDRLGRDAGLVAHRLKRLSELGVTVSTGDGLRSIAPSGPSRSMGLKDLLESGFHSWRARP